MSRVVIVDGLRTPFGRMGGKLKTWRPTELLGMTIKNILDRNGIENRAEVAVYAGSALHDVHTHNFARFAALYGGLPYESTATFIEMQCGSGITCINHAAQALLNGDEEIVVAGGAEVYSQMFAKFSMSVEPYKLIPPSAVPQQLAPNKEDCISMIEVSDPDLFTSWVGSDFRGEGETAVEWMEKNLAGSNAWFREVYHNGAVLTPEECVRQFGCVPAGAFLFIGSVC